MSIRNKKLIRKEFISDQRTLKNRSRLIILNFDIKFSKSLFYEAFEIVIFNFDVMR